MTTTTTTPAQRQLLRRLLARTIISHDDEADSCTCNGPCALDLVLSLTGLEWEKRTHPQARHRLAFRGDPDRITNLQYEALYFFNIQSSYGAWLRDDPLSGWLEVEESIGKLLNDDGWGALLRSWGGDGPFDPHQYESVCAFMEVLVARVLPDSYFDLIEAGG